jgi:hypothetical protein
MSWRQLHYRLYQFTKGAGKSLVKTVTFSPVQSARKVLLIPHIHVQHSKGDMMRRLSHVCSAVMLALCVLTPASAFADGAPSGYTSVYTHTPNEILAGTYTTTVISENSAYDGQWTMTLTNVGRIIISGKLYGTLTYEYSGRYLAQGHFIKVDTTWCSAAAIYDWVQTQTIDGTMLTLGGIDPSCPREFILNNEWHKIVFAQDVT